MAALTTADGQELLDLLAGHDVTGPDALRLGTRLRERFPAQLVADAMAQQELRVKGAAKFDRAARMFFTRAGLEQASAQVVAQHRRTRYAGAAGVADLCCGLGGDLVALAADGPVLGVDLDPVHLWAAQRNAAAYGVEVTTREADVRTVDLAGIDAVFVDPARRAGGVRRRVGDGEPPLDWCFALTERMPCVGVKAAPGLPHEAVPPGWELEFVSVHRELKEAALYSPALAGAARRATLLPGGETLVDAPGAPVEIREPGAYLLDPDPAVTRAGLVAELARTTATAQIDPHIAFLTTDAAVRTPFARTLRVLDSGPWHQKQLPERLRRLDIGSVDIRRRGLAGDVDALHKRLKLTGSRRATLVMTRVRDRPWALICEDIAPPTG